MHPDTPTNNESTSCIFEIVICSSFHSNKPVKVGLHPSESCSPDVPPNDPHLRNILGHFQNNPTKARIRRKDYNPFSSAHYKRLPNSIPFECQFHAIIYNTSSYHLLQDRARGHEREGKKVTNHSNIWLCHLKIITIEHSMLLCSTKITCQPMYTKSF